MTYQDFIIDINKNKLKTLYLFYGEEEYLIDYSLKLLKDKYIDSSFETLNYQILEGKDIQFEDIQNACETLPFMSEKKIVVVKDLGIFSRKKRGEVADEKPSKKKDPLKEYLQTLADYVCLIFVEKEGKVDKSKAIVKTIGKTGEIVEFSKLKGNNLNEWIVNTFKKYGKTIAPYTLNYLIEFSFYFSRDSNKTLYDLENEILKLSNFVGDKKEVTKTDIDNVMAKSLETNIFALLDSISTKNVNNSIKIYNEMCASDVPFLKILHMIVRQFRLIKHYIVFTKGGYVGGDAMSKLKISSFEYNKIARQSQNFSLKQLNRALDLCLECDKLIKTGSMDSKLAIEMLIIKLCQ
ncbi:DNA polymerase III subunit delta [Anaerosalibacter sp. Marseille-P3206]|uniref:DNA polymerase III subunit delta n=1 Tax=Anaerosalibacter sp. Marseille-P3206 TaxID=1871005 RepID=UPI0009864CEB|nr:DNA polymerase III subunit delta [Anaerosalibacter sp. Marseille-P3206]